MSKLKVIGSGMRPEGWNMFQDFFREILIKHLNDAKKGKHYSLEDLGEACGYSKSQVDNFLKGKTAMDEATAAKLVDFLGVEDKVTGAKLVEELNKELLRLSNPYMTEEEVERNIALYSDDSLEYAEWEREQEKQMAEMKPWFMEMDIRDCYLLDEHYDLYKKAWIPDAAWSFLQNYAAMEESEQESLRTCMELVTMPVGELYGQFCLMERFRKLACMGEEDIRRQVENDLVQNGRGEAYTKSEFLQKRKQEHWESFCNKVKDSSYATGDYFYEMMRFLPGLDNKVWETLILFLLMGKGYGDTVTPWQKLFTSIVPDAVWQEAKEGNGNVRED